MKKLLYLLPLVFLSCTKEQDFQKDPVTFELNYEGVHKEYPSSTAAKVQHVYSIVAQKEPSVENYFSFSIVTDSLKPGTYTKNLVHFREGDIVSTTEELTVVIQENKGGNIKGTFFGPHITEGHFENLKIIY